MKKILFTLLLFTGFLNAQTYPVNPTKFGKISLNTNGVSTSTSKINTQEADGQINYIDAANLPVPTTVTNALELKTTVSAGAISGFGLTNNGNGTVNIDSGIAYLRSTNDPYANIIKYPISAVTNLALTDNANNYVLVDYNGGSPTITVTTNASTINTQTNSLAYVIARVGNDLEYLSLVGQNVDPNAKLRIRFLNQEGIRRASGAVLGFSNRNLTLTSGVLFSGLIRINTLAFNTASPDTFTLAYNNGSTWTRTTGQTQVNNTQYNVSGTLTTMPNNTFRTDYVYLLPNNPSKLYVIMGTTTYGSLTLAKSAPRPSSLPVELQVIGLEVGRLFIEKNSAAVAEVQSSFANDFVGAAVPEHNSLSGIQGGTSGEYNHLTNAQVALVNGAEQTANKATDFTTVNNTLYPSVQAVENRIIGNTVTQNIIVVDGDSRPAGYTGGSAYPISDHLTLNIQNKTIYNTADGGATFGDFESEGVQWKQKAAYSNVDTKLTRYGWNILLIWAGYNDMAVRDQNAITTYQRLVGYANARKKAGWRVFVYTEPATTSIIGESRRLEYNLLVRANWSKFADGLVDLGSDEFLGLPGAASNTTYFVDGVHMTSTGYQIAADLSSAVVNRYTDTNVRIVNGQTLIQGTPADGTIGTEQVLTLQRESLPATSYSNAASFKLGRHTGVGGLFNPYTRLDFNLKSSLLNGYVSDVNVSTMFDTGQTGFGYTSISDMIDYKVAVNGKALVNNRIKSTAGIEWGNDVYQVGESRLYNDATGGTLLTGKTGSSSDFTLINGSGSGVFNNPTGTQNIVFSGSISAVSPSFTGTPTAPTATAGTNTTQIATTAFTQQELNTRIIGTPEYLAKFDTGNSVDSGTFSISGGVMTYHSTYTVSTLPTPSGKAFAVVTDATTPTYLGVLIGGGSVVCPVFYNGSAWVSH